VAVVIGGPPAAADDGPAPPYLADAAEPAVTTLAHDLGIPIEEAQRRIGWQDPAAELGEDLYEALGEHFGGLWIDEADGGRVKIGLVGGESSLAGAQAQTMIAQRSLGAVTDIVPTQFSYAQLERDSAWLSSAIGTVTDATGGRLSSEMRVSENRVVLLVPEGTALTSAQQAVVQAAEQQLGARLAIDTWSGSIQRQACGWNLGFNCDRPLRAGVRLYLDGDPNSSTDPPLAICTAAFNARSLSNGLWYVMTAGHCADKGQNIMAYQPVRTGQYHAIGQVHNSVDRGNDDFAIVRIENVPGWDPRNWVYVHETSKTVLDPDYYINATSTSPVGTRVCMSGATTWTWTDCGPVAALNVGGPGGLARARYCSQGGDSGAPVYSSHKARGIHIGATTSDCKNALFQGVREAARELNVRVHGT
jgi:streptogrisin C